MVGLAAAFLLTLTNKHEFQVLLGAILVFALLCVAVSETRWKRRESKRL
jgi:hypothetical protein